MRLEDEQTRGDERSQAVERPPTSASNPDEEADEAEVAEQGEHGEVDSPERTRGRQRHRARQCEPMIDVVDSSGAVDDASIQFTTALSAFRPGQADSTLVRPAYPDREQYVDVTNTGTAALTLREIQIAAPDVTVVPPLTAAAGDDIILQAGETQRFRLTYAPTLPSLDDPTCHAFDLTNGLVIVSDATSAAFEGAGSVFFKENRKRDKLTGTLDLARLRPKRRPGGGSPLFKRAELTGEFRATCDPVRVVRIINEMTRVFGPPTP